MGTAINWKACWSKWHQQLGWWGAAAILIWAVSGLAHPLMTWFGPQAVKFYPPNLQVDLHQHHNLMAVIHRNDLNRARIIKVIPGEDEALVQLTENDQQPRRYFSLSSHEERLNWDQQQAKWLASYYTGRDINDIDEVYWQTVFDQDYPAVNRLLPVYRVGFSGEEGLTAYIYTETNSLAALNNNYRQQMQEIFQILHTWGWLNNFDNSRVLFIGLLMLSLMAMCVTGISLVITLKSRRILQTPRRWHRLLAYVLWLPLLGWSVSGFYHLVKSADIEPVTGLRLSGEISLDNRQWANIRDTLSHYQGQAINALALVEGPSMGVVSDDVKSLYYRLSLSQTDREVEHTRSMRFAGKPSEKSAVYIDAMTGRAANLGDEAQARYLALRHTGQNDMDISAVSQVTHFGPDYDFRNKRLPVWRVDFSGETANQRGGLHIFVDPVTGILVDQNRQMDRAESWSFSILHKWNHLNPFAGRFYRDVLIVGTIIFCILMALLGILMLLKKRKSKQARVVSSERPALG